MDMQIINILDLYGNVRENTDNRSPYILCSFSEFVREIDRINRIYAQVEECWIKYVS
jgi:hypothetical protein